jgi:hypothetical protein
MKSFQQHYEAHIAPLLIHTDLVMAKIHQLDISFNFSAAHPWQHDLKQRLANHDFHFQRGKSWQCFITVDYQLKQTESDVTLPICTISIFREVNLGGASSLWTIS